MGGKAAILLVMGFSAIFLVFGYNFNNQTTRAVDNMHKYYAEAVVHNIATTGINLAANAIFLDPTWNNGYNDIDFEGGTFTVTVNVPANDTNSIQVSSTATFADISKTIIVILRPFRFSRFAYYSVQEGTGIWWTSNDVVRGPFHTQDVLRVQGRPQFWDRASYKGGLEYYNNDDEVNVPQFYKGHATGVDLHLPEGAVNDLEPFADENGFKFEAYSTTTTTTESYYDYWGRLRTRTVTTTTDYDDFYLEFNEDSVTYKVESNGPETTVLASDFAPNGVIYIKNGNLHINGVVEGRYSVVANGDSKGRVYLEDDIVYKTDPRTDPQSNDLLGIVAYNQILIADNPNNNNSINIHASMFSENAGFGAENHANRGIDGNINLFGGVIQKTRQPVGTFTVNRWTGATTISSGFNKQYFYDSRLRFQAPPEFPGAQAYQIVSWYE